MGEVEEVEEDGARLAGCDVVPELHLARRKKTRGKATSSQSKATGIECGVMPWQKSARLQIPAAPLTCSICGSSY